jgi:protein TonB
MTKKSLRARLPVLLGGTVLILLLVGLVWMIKGFIDHAEPPAKRQVQQISLVKPPPPKPDEKLPEDKPPPEPPKMEEKIPLNEPVPDQPPDNQPPPGDQLGVDADASAGSDGFGLAARKGGRDITLGGGGGSRARWYAGLLGNRIEQALNRDSKLLAELKNKHIVVRIWVNSSGQVERVEWDKGAVPADSEKTLREQLLALSVTESPDGIEQPIWYRFRPRG